MILSGEWSKQIITGILTSAVLSCATIGHAQDVGLVLTPSLVTGPEAKPSWWKARGVLDDQKPVANQSMVNAGQLKWATRQMHEELASLLPAQAPLFPLSSISPVAAPAPGVFEPVPPYSQNYESWKSGNHAVVTLGQLKNSTIKFYDLLHEISPAWLSDQLTRTGHPADGRKYPWTTTFSDDANKAPANIGQLKSVFALRLRESLDDDLLPDIFEHALIKYDPVFAGKTLNDIVWNPGDATVSLKGTDSNGASVNTPTATVAPNIGGSNTGALSASSLLSEHQAVGSVGGSFSVGGDGAANYSIPINIPKGTSGVEPQIALAYSSAAGNGSLGVGFDISGFQRITRGAATRLKDGFTDPVDFDANDRFFFDGELLIATTGTYGQDGTVYQTESNSFARIISHGQLGSGPKYWTVETKAGLTIELGNCPTSCATSSTSKGALVWNVNRVEDNVGNYYKVEYQLDVNGGPLDYRLARVKYTGNGAMLPYNEIRFNWEDRQDYSEQYIQGIKVRNGKRLSNIAVWSSNKRLFYYECGYQYNLANGASQLVSLTRCLSESNKLPSTQFNWAKEIQPSPASWKEDSLNKSNQYLTGKLKISYPNGTRGEPVHKWEYTTHTDHAHNYTSSVVSAGDDAGSQVNGFIDLNGDGLLDRVSHYDFGSPPTIVDHSKYGLWVALNTGNGFAKATKWWASAGDYKDNFFSWIYKGSQVSGFIDINGDALPDRVAHYNYATNEYGLWVSLNTGSGFLPTKKWWSSPYWEGNFLEWNYNGSRVAGFIDMNGDGLVDRVCHHNYNNGRDGLWVFINTGSEFAPATDPWWNSAKYEDNFISWDSDGSKLNGLVDMNGDGLVDRVAHREYLTANTGVFGFRVSINTGSGFQPSRIWGTSSLQNEDNYVEWNHSQFAGSKVTGLIDMNGDGLLDRVSHRQFTAINTGPFGLWVSINNGNDFGPMENWGTSLQMEDNFLEWSHREFGGSIVSGFVDLNGDGLLDRVSHRKYTAPNVGPFGLWVSINTGVGFEAIKNWGASIQMEDNFLEWHHSEFEGSKMNGFLDVNGDGFLDRISHCKYTATNTGEFGFWVSLNKRNNSFGEIEKWYSSPQMQDNFPEWISSSSKINGFIDLNGDGLIDRIHQGFFSRPNVHFNTGSGFVTDRYPQDLGPRITSIVDGLGAEIKIEYKRGSHDEVDDWGRRLYTKSAFNETESAAGITGVNGAGYLVSRYAEQDGLGGYRWMRQYYGERKVNRTKEVDLGFKWIESINEQRGRGTITTYSQEFPLQSLPLESLSYIQSGNSKILTSRETFSYAQHAEIQGVGGKIRFTYQAFMTSRDYAFEGPHATVSTLAGASPLAPSFIGNELSWATATNDSFDQWGNLVTSSSITSDNFTTENINTYDVVDSEGDKWILGRLLSSEVTKRGPSIYAPVTKISKFTYYTDGLCKGMLKSEVAEPSDPLAVVKSYVYDEWGNRASTTVTALNQPPRTTKVKYDATGRFPVKESNQLEHTAIHEYDSSRSLLLSSTGANGLTTRYFYDAWGTKILTRGPDGTEGAEITRYATPGDVPAGTGLAANQGIVFIRKTQGTGAAATTAYIDAQGRVLMSSAESFDGRLVFSRTDYDVYGRQFRQSLPFFAGETIRWSTLEFDGADRTFKTTAPDGSVATADYQGFTTVMTNPLGQTQTRVENARGWLVSTKDNNGNETTFTYTVDGKPLKTTAPGDHVITTNLDAFGQKTSMTDSDVGFSSTEYYGLGEVKKTTDAKGATVEFTYDILGRQKTRIVTDPDPLKRLETTTTTWTYDTAPGAGLGKIHTVEMKDGTGSVTYVSSVRYDVLGRVAETTVTQHGETFKSSVTYDAIGRPRTETDAGGLTVLHEYNARGFETGIRDYLTGEFYWKPLEYDASGRLLREELGNGVVNTHAFDQNRGTLLGSQSKKGSATLQNMAYEWDATGNFKKRGDLVQSLSEEFHYDSLNRLDWSQVTGKTKLNYAYTIGGSIKSKTNVGTYAYSRDDNAHAVIGITGTNGINRTFEYDSNGSLTKENRNGQEYRRVEWTAHADVKSFHLSSGPRVLKVDGTEIFGAGKTETSFDYDAGLDRSQKITTRDDLTREVTLYLGSYERIVTSSRANIQIDYATQKIEHRHSIGGLALKTFTEQGGVTSEDIAYYLKDHLGSLTASVDKNGVVKERYSFDAWGARRDAATWSDSRYDELTKTTTTNRGYTGHEMLDEIGLVHMNGRIYDPEIGRVLSGDPIIQEPDNAQNYNRYSYVINNPLSLTDPSGFSFLGKKIFGFKKKLHSKINNFRKSVKNKVTKWLAENEWAMIVVTIVVGIVTMGIGLYIAGAMLAGTAAGTITIQIIGGIIAGFLSGAINTALAGGGWKDILRGAFLGAVQGAVSGAVGGILPKSDLDLVQLLGKGVAGGASEAAIGGKFEDGFISSIKSGFMTGYVNGVEGIRNFIGNSASLIMNAAKSVKYFDFLRAAASIVAVPSSVISGDIFYSRAASEMSFVKSINGIFTSPDDADIMGKNISSIASSPAEVVANPTSYLGIGDLVQVLMGEAKIPTISSFWMGESINATRGGDIYPHSQGGNVTQLAAWYFMDGAAKANTRAFTYGAQTTLTVGNTGFAFVYNIANPGDLVPRLSPWNIITRAAPGTQLHSTRLKGLGNPLSFAPHSSSKYYSSIVRL